MTVKLHRPYEPQKRFMQSTARHTAFGGARGGGKSDAARSKAVLLALKHPGVQILFLRRMLNDLRENHLRPLLKILGGAAVYRESTKEFLFPNGSRILLGYCDAERDVLKYQGQSYDVIFLEEATQFTEWQYDQLKLSNRPSGLCKKFSPRMYYTCNPGGVGHQWVKRLFIDRRYKNAERAEDYAFIPSKVYDNRYLMQHDPDYVRQLENLPENLRKAFLEGRWDVFDGQYFGEFDRNVHVVRPHPIPGDCTIYRTLDYGLDMLACYWIAVDRLGRALVYKELFKPNLIIRRAAEEIAAMTTENVTLTYAPPDLWNRRQDSGRSVAEIFADCGVVLTKASNDRVSGWMDLHEWLTPEPDEFGGRTPRLQITENCGHLIESIPMLIYDKNNPSDAALEPHEYTHGPDAIRYFISGRPMPVTRAPEEEDDSGLSAFLNYGL